MTTYDRSTAKRKLFSKAIDRLRSMGLIKGDGTTSRAYVTACAARVLGIADTSDQVAVVEQFIAATRVAPPTITRFDRGAYTLSRGTQINAERAQCQPSLITPNSRVSFTFHNRD
jgi:hypothetical protein